MKATMAVLLLLVSLAAGCGGGGERSLFAKRCSPCHSLDLSMMMSFDRAKWEETVRRMSGYATANIGPISAEDQAAIVEYLLRVAGRK